MKRIGLLYRPGREDSVRLTGELCAQLRESGVDVWQGPVTEEDGLCEVARELDLLITLGGDGTIVRATRCVSPVGVPILGVNLGRLGFLAEVEPSDVAGVVPKVLGGEFFLEERAMLHAELVRQGETILASEAINDVVMGRGSRVRTVHVAVSVDGHYVMTQTADGMIVSSPTGSTAYCLSAGGPIIAPETKCLVVTPVAAHLAIAHAIVIPSDSCVRLCLIKGEGATLTVDGQMDALLEVGDEVSVTASETTAKFVRFGNRGYFYETVLRKLRSPDQGQGARIDTVRESG